MSVPAADNLRQHRDRLHGLGSEAAARVAAADLLEAIDAKVGEWTSGERIHAPLVIDEIARLLHPEEDK